MYCMCGPVLSTVTHELVIKTMSRKTNSINGATSKGGQLSIARKLEARGLGIKYTRVRQNTQNLHSAPFRHPSVRENYEDPIKNFKVFPAGKKPDTEYAVYIRLHAHWSRITCSR